MRSSMCFMWKGFIAVGGWGVDISTHIPGQFTNLVDVFIYIQSMYIEQMCF